MRTTFQEKSIIIGALHDRAEFCRKRAKMSDHYGKGFAADWESDAKAAITLANSFAKSMNSQIYRQYTKKYGAKNPPILLVMRAKLLDPSFDITGGK